MAKSFEQNFTEGHVTKQLFNFAMPIFLANALITLYSLVDTIVVGQFVGSDGISAVTTGSQFMFLLTLVGMGISNGGQIVIARMKGIGSDKALGETIGTLLTLSVLLGIVISVAGVILVNPALALLNTPEATWDQAGDYMFWTSIGMVFHFIYSCTSAVLRGLGDSKRPLIFVAIATVTNIVLDIVFVGPMQMGAAGAAIATTIAIAVSAIFSVCYLYINRKNFVFDFKLTSFIPRKYCVKELLRMGIPQIVQSAAIQLSMSFVLALVNVYGVAASATLGVGGKIINLFVMPTSALSTAGSSMAAQNIGANKLDRAKQVVLSTFGISLVITVIGAVILAAVPQYLVMIFDSSEEVIALCSVYLRINIVHNFGLCALQSLNAACLGVGNALLSTVGLMFDGVVLRLSLSLLFTRVFDFGILGLFWASSIAPVGAGTIFAIYFFGGGWLRYHSRHLDRLSIEP